MNLIQTIQELIKKKPTNDSDLISDLFLHIYHNASKDERDMINKMCVCLTGLQFDTVLIRAGIEKPLNKIS